MAFIRLNRNFFNSKYWRTDRAFSQAEAWLDLIQMARFEADPIIKILPNGRQIKIKRGEIHASLRFLLNRWGWKSIGTVKRFVDNAKKEHQIEHRTEQGETILKLCNYDCYNPIGNLEETPNGTPTEHRRNTDGTNIKNIKNINNIYNTNTRACMREENFENEDLNNSSNQDAQSEKEITAWQVFNQNSLELSDWFVSRWKAGKKYYKAGAVGKIVINGINRINLQEIAKEFTQEQINVALNGLFMQKTIYKEFTLTPFKFLQMEHFQRFYQAGLNGTQVFEDKKKYKAGALRSVGDL